MIEKIAFLIVFLLIPFLYSLARKQLLKKQVLRYLLIVSIFFSIIAMVQSVLKSSSTPKFYLFLYCPLYDLVLLILSRSLFKKVMKRNPKDAQRQFLAYDDGLWTDRFYDFILLLLWLVVPIGLLGYFYKS